MSYGNIDSVTCPPGYEDVMECRRGRCIVTCIDDEHATSTTTSTTVTTTTNITTKNPPEQNIFTLNNATLTHSNNTISLTVKNNN